MTTKRIIATLLVLMMALGAFSGLPVSAEGKNVIRTATANNDPECRELPADNGNPTRTQSHYQNFSTNYTLTGNGATDMVAVALAQEGLSGSDLGYTEGWCADFVGDCAILAGQSSAVPLYGGAAGLNTRIVNAGGTITTSNPQPGDICFIDWEGGGGYDHVEIVYAVSGNRVSTIGGNSGSNSTLYTRVVKKHNPLSTSVITCIVRPAYSGSSNPSTSTPPPSNDSTDPTQYTVPTGYLNQGSSGEGVKWLQACLCQTGYTCTVDGQFGSGTVSKLKQFQRDYGLTVDGGFGPEVRTKFLELLTCPTPSVSYSASPDGAEVTISFITSNVFVNDCDIHWTIDEEGWGVDHLTWNTNSITITVDYSCTLRATTQKSCRYTSAETACSVIVNESNAVLITFNSNGGTCSESTRDISPGSAIGELPIPTRDGYDFAGWYLYPEGACDPVTPESEFYSDTVLYAFWANRQFSGEKIAFELNGGEFEGEVNSHHINGFNIWRDSGFLVVYNCDGHLIDSNYWGKEVAVNSDGLVIAKRLYNDPNQLTVPVGGFILSGHNAGMDFIEPIAIGDYVSYDRTTSTAYHYTSREAFLANAKYVQSGHEYGELPVPTRDGYVFAGWYDALFGENYPISSSTLFSGTTTLHAHWDIDAPDFDTDDSFPVPFNAMLIGTEAAPAFSLPEGEVNGNVSPDVYCVINEILSESSGYYGWCKIKYYDYTDEVIKSGFIQVDRFIHTPCSLIAAFTANGLVTTYYKSDAQVNVGALEPGDPVWVISQEGQMSQIVYGNAYTTTGKRCAWVMTADVSHTVTFLDWDGTTIENQTVYIGCAAVAPSVPIRNGYTFTGWDVDFGNVTSDLTVTAQYSINMYTVTFTDWDGTVLKTETVEHGHAATAPADPVRDGYTFIGWDVDFSNVTGDLIVTAQYEENVIPTPTVPPEDAVAFTLSEVYAVPDTDIAVDLNINGEYEANALTLSITYDPELLTVGSITKGEVWLEMLDLDATVMVNNNTPGIVRMMVIMPSSAIGSSGKLLTLNLHIAADIEYGTDIPIIIEITEFFTSPFGGSDIPIPYTVANGIVHVDCMLGDINGDGTLNASDVILIMRYALDMIELNPRQLAAADYNGDGQINASDALMLMRKCLGLI